MDAVDRALASLDAQTASRAEPALDALIGPPGERLPVGSLSQLEVQQFLWITLPTRFLTDEHDRHEIAWALGDVMATLGQDKYAGLCRARKTHEILAAWHRDETEGARMAADAEEISGVLPPDTPSLTFGEVMGGSELNLFTRLSVAIEQAIDEGRIDPASRSFPRARERLIEPLVREQLTAVRRERAESWAAGFRAEPGWLGPVLPLLERSAAVPENVELSLAPARALLTQLGPGVTLTAAGYLPPGFVLELDDRFRWSEEVLSTPKKEIDLPPLVALREHLSRQRLLAMRKGVLTVTARGRACLGDDEQFWAAVTELSPRWDDFAREVIAVSGALLLAEPDVERADLAKEVAGTIRPRWKGGDTASFDRDVHWVYIEWYRVGFALGWWEAKRGRWLDRLSPRGVAAAARAFWSVAGAPGTYAG